MSPKPSAVPPSSYRLGDMLGSGLYGIVREAIHVKTAKCYACKIMEKELMKGWRWTVRNEIAVLKRVSGENPNIVTLHDHFESVQNVYLCLDLCTGGRLFDQTAMRPYYEADAAALVRTLFTAVKYIHAAGVIHRNLNPKSILFRTPAEERDIVIAGFGFSRFIKEDESIMEGWSDGMYPGCTAPEVFLKKGHSKPVDVWAMGTITYFLLAGYTPFHRDTPKEQVKAIIAGDYEFEPKEHWTGVSDTARDFMKACLTIDPAGRLSAAEALEHKWLASTTPHFVPEPSSQSGDLADLLLHGNMQVDLPPSSSPAEPQISSDELACIDAAADPGHRRLLEAGQLFVTFHVRIL
ncbi:kinase-like domain-containing protein [Mycena vulgaris]|nr:kinase-like domain-containing protein [Mycena vulgaris]